MKHKMVLFVVIAALASVASAAYAQWTPWLDRDLPSGVGDFETLEDFLQTGQVPCDQPRNIQCQTIDGTDFAAAGQVYSCTPQRGGVCVNARQPGGAGCLDYRVRFQCCPDLAVSCAADVEFGCDRSQNIRAQVTCKIKGGAEPYVCSGLADNFPLKVSGNECVAVVRNAGTHVFTITDSAGDSVQVPVEVEDVITSSSSVNCSTGSGTVSATSKNGPVTYRWNPPVDMMGPTQSPGPGTYEVLVTDPAGCFRAVEVTIPRPPC